MQWIILCSFLLSLLLLFVGLSKSGQRKPRVALQHCFVCGWTREQVQDCQLEHNHKLIVAPLCFECTIEQEAIPVKVTPAIA